MKEKNIKDTPKGAEERPVSNVRAYFTEEVNAKIAEMSVKEMESTMKDLMSLRHWIALIKYTSMRMPLLDATLRGTNPSEDPSKISWAQGAMAGICDVENYVIDLNAPKKEEQTEEKEDDGVILK